MRVWSVRNWNLFTCTQTTGDRRENIITATGHNPESTAADEFQKKFKFNLMKKFQCLNEWMLKQENRPLLNEIYTELYITEGDSGDVNKEHEVKQIEAASRRNPTEDTPIKCSDIFKSLPKHDKAIRNVLTKPLSEQDKAPIRNVVTMGVAGIGKTVSVQKFVLDWAEGKTNQDVHLIFPLPFRELNLMKDQKLSLKTVRVCDVTESAPVHVLLINLIKGNLLPSALIWITSRPAAADQIPSECVHRITEVRGFNDPQKEEYFRKRISDQNLANRIITQLKSLRSLYIMCHIPVFCWITAAVLERMLGEAESGEIPKTLTQMYTHFLIIQTNIIREKYLQKQESDEEMLLKLGKLAFQQLEKQNLIFYEEDLRECDIDVTEAAVYSGVCTQIFREELGFHQSKVYCFVHLSIQEHLAALYVHLTFRMKQRNVLKQNQVCRTPTDVHRSAVDQALDSQTGHLDLFLRFLLGLSLDSNQKLLHSLVTQTGSSSQNKEETVQYIKKKISKELPAEKSINLFHCLNELGDDSLVEEIQQYLKSGAQSELSPSQWSALVFVVLTSAQDLEEFDLNKYITPDKIRDKILVRLMPVIAASRKAIIRCSQIAGRSGKALTSVLNSETSSLRELHLTVNILDLSENKLEDSGVKRLSALLENPECKVKTLGLRDCGVSDEVCAALASALRSNPSHLRKLYLSGNKVGDSGVKCLSAVLENPHCKLEILRLCKCGVSDEGCAALASALRSNPSHLRYLNLSVNRVGDSGVKCLSAVLENPHCKLETLWLEILFSLVLLNVIMLKVGLLHQRQEGVMLGGEPEGTEGETVIDTVKAAKRPPQGPGLLTLPPSVLQGTASSGELSPWSPPGIVLVPEISPPLKNWGSGREGACYTALSGARLFRPPQGPGPLTLPPSVLQGTASSGELSPWPPPGIVVVPEISPPLEPSQGAPLALDRSYPCGPQEGDYIPKVPSVVPRPIRLRAFYPPLFQAPDQERLNRPCPVRALDTYVHGTGPWRRTYQLLVCYSPPKRGLPCC
ncbi:NACHT, LRR and PYD domains-containing protein 3 [Silurus meridionalis]|nr:NACHT, LRR and PYD domains-containing protein 3 [Silurus meridionalis]